MRKIFSPQSVCYRPCGQRQGLGSYAQRYGRVGELARHRLVLWPPTSPKTLAMRTNALLGTARRPLNTVRQMPTFGLLAMLVGAGYGAALAAKAQSVARQSLGIVMRSWPVRSNVRPPSSEG